MTKSVKHARQLVLTGGYTVTPAGREAGYLPTNRGREAYSRVGIPSYHTREAYMRLIPHYFSQRMPHWKPLSQYKTNSETGDKEAQAGYRPTVKRVLGRHTGLYTILPTMGGMPGIYLPTHHGRHAWYIHQGTPREAYWHIHQGTPREATRVCTPCIYTPGRLPGHVTPCIYTREV